MLTSRFFSGIPLLIVTLSTINCDDFFDKFEEVPSSTPESLGAVPKCGDGSDRGRFKCVPYYNCDPLTNTTVEYPEVDGSNIISPRFQQKDPQCPHYLQVCCQIANAVTPAENNENIPYVNLEFEPKCGLTIKNQLSKRFSWMVSLFNSTNSRTPFCGGSLLTPIAVLTAAHCVEKLTPDEIKIKAGQPQQEKSVSKIIIHRHYLTKTLYSDIAILILNSSLSQAENLGTVCIPKELDEINLKDCVVSGWGRNSKGGAYPRRVKKIPVSVISREECQSTLRKTIGQDFILENSFICALGDQKNDVCKGDGGGPLVCPDSSNRYFQVGIVSWGVNCGENATPGVYTNVTQFRDWIDYKLAELGYNPNPYSL